MIAHPRMLRSAAVCLLTLVCLAPAAGCNDEGSTDPVDGSTAEGGNDLDATPPAGDAGPEGGGPDAAQDGSSPDAGGDAGDAGEGGTDADGGEGGTDAGDAGTDAGGGCASFEDCDDLDPATLDACESNVCTHRTVTYDGDVQALYAAHCTPCHTGAPCSGGACLVDSYADLAKASSVCGGSTVAECTETRTSNGSMPKGKGCTGDPVTDAANAACLSAEDHRLLAAWIAAGWPEN